MKIDLILIDRQPSLIPRWDLGKVLISPDSVSEFSFAIRENIKTTEAEYFLFWKASLGPPDIEKIRKITHLPGDVWHCGLKFDIKKFKLLDYIYPVWMLNKDPDKSIESSSYRLTFDACIIKKEVIKQLGFININFKNMNAASQELGFRYIFYGAFVRYIPWFVDKVNKIGANSLPFEDELLFVRLHFRKIFVRWAFLKAIFSGYIPFTEGIAAYLNMRKIKKIEYQPFKRMEDKYPFEIGRWQDKISVVIPTLKRYPYLKKLLAQLSTQTLKPREVIIVDQTPEDLREEISKESGLRLNVLYQRKPGQSSSRNRGVAQAKGEYVLFFDDDIEIKNDLIERHAKTIDSFGADVSSGVIIEPGMGNLPFNFTYTRISNVFPAALTLVKKSVFEKSGLFDLAFERGKRADHDLGMRVYLSGALMVLNPDIEIVHHRACSGGLREYKVRKTTRYLSKKNIFLLDLPSATEIYLWLKYFHDRLAKEMIYIKILSNFYIEGGLLKKLARAVIIFLLVPSILVKSFFNYKKASELIESKNNENSICL